MSPINLDLPVLYNFRRCPYAMRARLALTQAGILLELREIQLSHKPEAMLKASPKGTVPVLVLNNGQVIEESLEIMLWALAQHDPDHWLDEDTQESALELIQLNDGQFKYFLDRYKYADRYPQFSAQHYRQQAEQIIGKYELRLQRMPYLCGEQFGLADAAILPFIRQFAAVDPDWFTNAPYPALRVWLNKFLNSELFQRIMHQYPVWKPGFKMLMHLS